MKKTESDITNKVRLAIIKAAQEGEKLSQKVQMITMNAVNDALIKGKPTINKIETVSTDVAKGFLQAAAEGKLIVFDLVNHAVDGISHAAESFGEQAAKAAQAAAKKAIGFVGGLKEQYEKIEPPEFKTKTKTKIKSNTGTKTSQLIPVKFSLKAPKGKKVDIACSFNGWQDRNSMKYIKGSYEITLELPQGSYEYKFLVDGDWVADPLCSDTTINVYGTVNNIVNVN